LTHLGVVRVEHCEHGLVGGVPGGGELPQRLAATKVLQPGHPGSVLAPGEVAPFGELVECGVEVADVDAPGDERLGDLGGGHLDLVTVAGLDEHAEDRQIARRTFFGRGAQRPQLRPGLAIGQSLVQRIHHADATRDPLP